MLEALSAQRPALLFHQHLLPVPVATLLIIDASLVLKRAVSSSTARDAVYYHTADQHADVVRHLLKGTWVA